MSSALPSEDEHAEDMTMIFKTWWKRRRKALPVILAKLLLANATSLAAQTIYQAPKAEFSHSTVGIERNLTIARSAE